MKSSRLLSSLVAASLLPLAAVAARAEEAAAPAAEKKCFTEDLKLQKLLPESEQRIAVYGWAQAGITSNPQAPTDNQNFGRLFDDRNDGPLLNQLSVTAERALSQEKGTEWDWGFKAQGIYGSDARYTRTMGLFDNYGSQSHQIDITEAYVSFHAPLLTDYGMDFRIGKFATIDGLETIDPRNNFFYSHSYIFNFGPFTHVGAIADFILVEGFLVHAGVTRGAGPGLDDNNNASSFTGGISYTMGDFTLVASSHAGPETNGNSRDFRSFTDVDLIWKATKKLTLSTDMAYYQDNAGAGAKAYGIAQYATYAISDALSVGLRGELFRDQNGFFVAQQGKNDDFINSANAEGPIDARTVGGGKTTYASITLGLNWKALSNLTIRPEVRYDKSTNGTKPFIDSTSSHQFTAAVDAIFTF